MVEQKVSNKKYTCQFCQQKEAVITDSGESFDGGDDWYIMLCTSCSKTWKLWIEHD